jgi:hypothetical protein
MIKLIATFHKFATAFQSWWNVVYRKEVSGVGYNVETQVNFY